MPKRVIDGEAVWSSLKLSEVEPARYRAEFANLLPLAYANGSFECHPRQLWGRVYAFNRPDVTLQDVEAILNEYERVKLLFRWTSEGKPWGYWVGIDKPGRLPSRARLDGRHEKLGAEPPVQQLRPFLSTTVLPDGEPLECQTPTIGQPEVSLGLGSGLGVGLGSGLGLGCQLVQLASSSQQEIVPPMEQEPPALCGSASAPNQADVLAQVGDEVSRLCEALSGQTGNPVTPAWIAPADRILTVHKKDSVLRIINWMFEDEGAAQFWPQRTHTMQNLCDHIFRAGETLNGKPQPPALIAQYNKYVRTIKAETAKAKQTTTEQPTELPSRLQEYMKRGLGMNK